MIMRSGVLRYAMAILLSLLWGLMPILAANGVCSSDSIAVVNGAGIARDEYGHEISQVQRRISDQGELPSELQLAKIEERVLEQMIGRELLYQHSQRLGIKVDASQVDARYSLVRQEFGTEDEFDDYLASQNLSEATIRTKIRRGLAIQQFIDRQIRPKISVTEKEAKALYEDNPELFVRPEQVHARHIFIRTGPGADQPLETASRQRMERIQQMLLQGVDFAELARAFSEDPSGRKGGDLGYIRRNHMPKPFEDAAFALKPGEASGIVETQDGYYLIKVIDKVPAAMYDYEEIKDAVLRDLSRRKIKEEVARYLARVRKNADVKRFLE